jgi:SAM-dependent methyltransferase
VSSTTAPRDGLRRVKSAKIKQLAPRVFSETPLTGHGPRNTPEIAVPSAEHLHLQSQVHQVLNQSAELIQAKGHSEFFRNLGDTLSTLKSGVDQETWNTVVVPATREHPLAALMQECPLTKHSFTRPRGYPGDAGLLDLIYRHDSAQAQVEGSTEAGRTVFGFTAEVSACEAVRQRRKCLAQKIDQVARERPGAEMLAVACGHLREAELSRELKLGHVGRFVATDQDPASLDVVETYAGSVSSAIETRKLSVRDFITAKHGLSGFDLVYAAGLYDYLDDRLAARLTRKLFSLLKPGGRLLVANFLNGIWELPYMEAYMDWHLLYRSEAQIRAFAGEISEVDIASTSYFEDDAACVGYLELVRA